MRTIKIKFVDWHKNLFPNTFLSILEKKYEVLVCDDPDYLFYADFGKEHLKYNCIKIYYTSENLVPDFNICDYAIGFHFIHFENRYLRFPIYGLFKYKQDYELALNKHKIDDTTINSKTKFCNFVYSNGKADPTREQFFNYLNRYKTVDSGGKYKNNIGEPVSDKFLFQKEYKFSIAFENSSMSGYTTEKIVQAFAAQTIPIYWGDPNINLFFNEKAFINVQKFNSFDDVLERIKEIDNNPALYKEILKEPMLIKEELDYNNLDSFLFQIFDGDPKNYRRSNSLRGKWYQDYHKKMSFIEENPKIYNKIISFLKQKFRY